MLDMDDDEDPMPAAGPNTYFTTKHEVIEADIPIPEVDEVGSDEVLEKVGEVMNIIDRLAIVVGLPVDSTTGRRADQALDSETLLVFDDRKVMGYVRLISLAHLCHSFFPTFRSYNTRADL